MARDLSLVRQRLEELDGRIVAIQRARLTGSPKCLVCGEIFERKRRGRAKTCSSTCYTEWKSRRRTVCVVCRETFSAPHRYKPRVCSLECYQHVPDKTRIHENEWTFYDPFEDPWRPAIEAFACSKIRVTSDQVWGITGINKDSRTYRQCRRLGLVMKSLGFKNTVLTIAGGKQRGWVLR